MFGGEFHLVLAAALQREQRHAAERRVVQLLPKLQFLLEEAHEVMPPRELDRRMKRRERLHKHLAFDVTAAGAAGDLREQLKGALPRAEIRLVQRGVRVDDAHQRDVGKMQPLRDHLRADEDVNFAVLERVQHAPVILLPLHHVRIHAPDARARKKFSQDVLHLLRAGAGKADGGIFAFLIRADLRYALAVAADVAGQLLLDAMIRQRHAAIRALGHVAALGTLQRG